jgi:hypothetical protein
MITASDWGPLVRNTLRGFCTVTLSPSGIVLHECTLHEMGDKRWISLPAKPRVTLHNQPGIIP